MHDMGTVGGGGCMRIAEGGMHMDTFDFKFSCPDYFGVFQCTCLKTIL